MGDLGLAMMATLVAMGFPFHVMADSPMATAQALDLELLWLARTIQGEGCHLLGERKDEAARWMAWSVFTRVEGRWWPDNLVSVITADNGYKGALTVQEPMSWAMAQAELYLDLWHDGIMVGTGPPFVLSLQDIEALGGEVTVQGPLYHMWNGPWHLFFLWKWPEAVETSSSGSGGPGLRP